MKFFVNNKIKFFLSGLRGVNFVLIVLLVLFVVTLVVVRNLRDRQEINSQAAGGRVFYVSPSGSDANVGNASSPWKTTAKAVANASPGDTVVYKDGTYGSLNISDKGSSGAWITYKAENKGKAVLDGGGSVTSMVDFNGANYVILDGFEIKGAKKTGLEFWNSHNVKIINNHIHDNGLTPINDQIGQGDVYVAEDCTFITFDSNIVSGSGNSSGNPYRSLDHGIYVGTYGSGPSDIYITNNIFYNNTNGWHIQLYGSGGNGKNIYIVNNTFDGANPSQPGQIEISDFKGSNIVVQNNVFTNYKDFPVQFNYNFSASGVKVNNNVADGGTMYGERNGGRMGGEASGNITNANLGFLNAGNHDYHLGAGSQAINAGAAFAGLTSDFDGKARPQGGAYDAGAFESGGAGPVPTTGPTPTTGGPTPTPPYATPTLYCIGSCPTGPVTTMTPAVSPSGAPTTQISSAPTPTTNPCVNNNVNSTNSTQQDTSSVNRHRGGGFGGFLQQFIQFIIDLINKLIQLIGGGTIPPIGGTPTPTPGTTNPTPTLPPTGITVTPAPTQGGINPTPTVNPCPSATPATGNPTNTPVPGNPTTGVTQPPVGGVGVQVTFTESQEDISNPERGFNQGYSINDSTSDSVLDSALKSYYNSGNRISGIDVRLDKYRNGPLPANFNDFLNSKFALLRKNGLKMFLRFKYNQPNQDGVNDDVPLSRMLEHIKSLSPVLKANEDVLLTLQAGFVGKWGEWHDSTNGIDKDENQLKQVRDALLEAMPASRAVSFRNPERLNDWYPDGSGVAQTAAGPRRYGFHNDGILSSFNDAYTFGKNKFDEAENQFYRTYASKLNAQSIYGGEVALDVSGTKSKDCKSILDYGSSLHLTYFNGSVSDNWGGVFMRSWKDGGCLEEVSKKIGYRIFISGMGAKASNIKADLVIRAENKGWVAPVNTRFMQIILKDLANGKEYSGTGSVDLRTLLDGTRQDFGVSVNFGQVLPSGTQLEAYVGMPDPLLTNDPRYSIRPATVDSGSAKWDSSRGIFKTGLIVVIP